jgi:hypothetical protein
VAQIRINVGYQTQVSRAKFRVGEDPKEADRRKARIEALYADAVTYWRSRWPKGDKEEIGEHDGEPPDGLRFVWGDDPVASEYAQRLAKGETVFTVAIAADQGNYVGRINSLQRKYPSLAFVPEDLDRFAESLRFGQSMLEKELDQLKVMGYVPQSQATITAATSTLHHEIDRFVEAIKVEYFDKTEGHVSDSGMYKIKKMNQLREHSTDLPLNQLDLPALDSIYQTIRSRPIAKKTGKPLAYGTCQKLLTEIGGKQGFLVWLETLSKAGWERPAKFHLIKTKIKTLDSDSDEAAQAEVFDLDQLVILAKYATPLERMFMLLGLNCAYGADQIGRLKVSELHLDDERPTVRRIRRKKGIRGIHPLWKQTVEGMRLVLAKHSDPSPTNFALLTETGNPYWRKTKKGNRAPMIPNRWKGLLERVAKDYPEFPMLPFNCVRNTSVDMVRQIAGAEMGKLQATHKHQSKDVNLRRYSNPRIRKLLRIHRRIEAKLKPVFEASAKPWEQPERQTKATRRKVDQILELVGKGLSDKAVGKQLGISHMTVWRRRKKAANLSLRSL